ncbi:hypothetical protein EHO58_18985 [Leptospira selangorensis]|nr:hypothetical protein EHO58_18985 [Leptospira selangorensis]
MTLFEKLENSTLLELIESGEIVSLMIPPYRYRVEEFYNCQVFVSKIVWSELNTIYSKSRDKKSPTRIVYNLMAGSAGNVVDTVEENIEIFLVYFKGLLPSLNRFRFARNRWSKNGVHNQVAEGNHRVLKTAFAAYGYIKPKYSQMYLNEFSFIKNANVFGLDVLVESCVDVDANTGMRCRDRDAFAVIRERRQGERCEDWT